MAAGQPSSRETFFATKTDSKPSSLEQFDKKLETIRKLDETKSKIPTPIRSPESQGVSTSRGGTPARERRHQQQESRQQRDRSLPRGSKPEYFAYNEPARRPRQRYNSSSEVISEGAYSESPKTTFWTGSHGSLPGGIHGRTDRISDMGKLTVGTQRDSKPTSPFPRKKSTLEGVHKFSTDKFSGEDHLSIAYKMDHKRRGKAVIFSHKTFEDEETDPRVGAQIDVNNLRKNLPRLGFLTDDIIIHEDLTFANISKTLESLKNEPFDDCDCLLVMVLTHGTEGEQLHAKDTTYPTEKIWKPFLGDKCEGLRGKPKIFFIVACRGRLADPGVTLETRQRRPSTATDSTPIVKTASYNIPIHADVLTIYSTQPLHYSFREEERGTWYIEAFCNELQKLPAGASFNFTDFLTHVNLMVGVAYEAYEPSSQYHRKRQCPSYTSTLTRLIYITPTNIGK